MTEPTWEELKEHLRCSADKLYHEDRILFDIDSSERSMVFRFSLYLSQELCAMPWMDGLVIDCEYNRDRTMPKHANPKERDSSLIIPDLIIHSRNSSNRNILLLEFKKRSNSKWKLDEQKVKDAGTAYGYTYAATMVFGKRDHELKLIHSNHSI